MRSTIEQLHRKLHKRWVPKWYDAFCDRESGGFHERLGHNFKPVETGYKRLLTQCRQLAVYAYASQIQGGLDYSDTLGAQIDFMTCHYQGKFKGSWRFSTDYKGRPYDNRYDLYAHAFVIFTFCHLDRAMPDLGVKEYADQTLDFIEHAFRLHDAPGFAEALDEKGGVIPGMIRRQDPHMHLFEACLFAYENWEEQRYLDMAAQILILFEDYFIHGEQSDLVEYFDDRLRPHPDCGKQVKPGHYFEWVWLLQKYMCLSNSRLARLEKLSDKLLEKGNVIGWDKIYGGIYDLCDHNGKVLEETKRIWPFAEALKANAMMLDHLPDRQALKDRMADMVEVFEKGYIQDRGFWTETLARDLSPVSDVMPGTTPYHLYFGIEETLDYLKQRGASKSMISGAAGMIYSLRRGISGAFRALKP